MINKAYKTSLLPILRSTKSLPPASLTVPRLALVMAHAKAGFESYPSRRIHVEDISSQVPELPIRIFRLKNDLKAYLDLHSHNDETHEAIERIFEGYYAYSKEKFKQILMPDTVNIYVQATMIREFPTFFITPGHIAFFPTDEKGHIIEDRVISFRNEKGMVPGKKLIFKLDHYPVKPQGVFNGTLYPFLKDAVIYNSAGDCELISEFRLFCKKAMQHSPDNKKLDFFAALNASTIIQCDLSDLVGPNDIDIATTRLRLLEEIRQIKENVSQYYYLTDGWLVIETAYYKLRKEYPELFERTDIDIETVVAKLKQIDPTCEPEKVDASNCVTYVIALRGDKFKIEHLRPEAAAVRMLEYFLEKYFARLMNPGIINHRLANILKPIPDQAPAP